MNYGVQLQLFDEKMAGDVASLSSRPEVSERLGRLTFPSDDSHTRVRVILVDGLFAGVTGVVRSGVADGSDVELFCALIEAFENRGVATAACRMLLNQRRDLPRVLACIAPDNEGGKALAARLGFVRNGTRSFSQDEVWELR